MMTIEDKMRFESWDEEEPTVPGLPAFPVSESLRRGGCRGSVTVNGKTEDTDRCAGTIVTALGTEVSHAS